MALWKQLVLSVVTLAMALVIAAFMSPVAADYMARHGLAAPMRLMGLSPPAAEGGGGAAGNGAGQGRAQGQGQPGQGQTGQGQTGQGQTGQAGQGQRPGGNRDQGRKATVVAEPAGSAVINDRVTALGTGAALQSVTVLPKANGTLIEVAVSSGQQVPAGQVIGRLDSGAQEIALEKARLAADDAQRTLERNRLLVQNNAAPANQTQAVELAAEMADLAVRAAERDLADRVIAAPIAGLLGIMKISSGNAVTPQTQIVTIENTSALIVNFWMTERLAGQVRLGDAVTLVPVSRPDLTLSAKLASIDNQIDPASGTFQVQALVDNPDGTLRPGMSFTVAMQFDGQSYVTVNPLAVQWGSGGAFVWRVTEDKAEKVPVRVIQRNTESVLVAGELQAGDTVVSEGLDGLKPGADVQIFGAPRLEAAADAPATSGSKGGATAGADANPHKKPVSGDAASAGN